MLKLSKSIEVFFLESLLKISLASIIIVMLVRKLPQKSKYSKLGNLSLGNHEEKSIHRDTDCVNSQAV